MGLGASLFSFSFQFVGGLILSALFPPPPIEIVGPRSTDVGSRQSSYGKPIPDVRGVSLVSAVQANVFYYSGLIEVVNVEEETSGGFFGIGGQTVKQITYTYFAHCAVGLCRGPIDGVLRIWANRKIIYDARGTSDAGGVVLERVSPTLNSFDYWRLFAGFAGVRAVDLRIYKGTATQTQDALLIEEIGGGVAADTSAYRDLAYVVWENMELTDFQNALPTMEFEVAVSTTGSYPVAYIDDPAGLTDGINDSVAIEDNHSYIDPFEDVIYMAESDGIPSHISMRNSDLVAQTRAIIDVSFATQFTNHLGNATDRVVSRTGDNTQTVRVHDYASGEQLYTLANQITGGIGCILTALRIKLGGFGHETYIFVGGPDLVGGDAATLQIYRERADGVAAIFERSTGKEPTGLIPVDSSFRTFIFNSFENGPEIPIPGASTQYKMLTVLQDANKVRILQQRVLMSITQDPVFGITGASTYLPAIEVFGDYATDGTVFNSDEVRGWCMLPNEGAFILASRTSMAKIDWDSGNVTASRQDLGFFSPNNWTKTTRFGFFENTGTPDAGIEVVTIRTTDLSEQSRTPLQRWFEDDPIIADPEDDVGIESSTAYDSNAHSITFVRPEIVGQGTNEPRIAKIFIDRFAGNGVDAKVLADEIDTKAGLADFSIDLFDNTPLAGTNIRGMTTVAETPRAWFEELMPILLFEKREEDVRMETILRGGAPVLTLDEDLIGIQGDDSSSTQLQRKEQAAPQRLTLRYKSFELDYEPDAQFDERNGGPELVVDATNQPVRDTSVVLVADEARQLVQKWLYTAWREMDYVSGETPWAYMRLSPGDVVNWPIRRQSGTPEILEVRLGQVTHKDNYRVRLEGVVEDTKSFTSIIEGGEPIFGSPTVPIIFGSTFHALNTPLLGDNIVSTGSHVRAYFAGTGVGDDTFYPGFTGYESDDGTVFEAIGTLDLMPPSGFIVGTPPDPVNVDAWNFQSMRLVFLTQEGRVATATHEEIMNGANLIAIMRNDGFVELAQFKTVTSFQSATNVFDCTDWLRGRRGTEPYATGHGSSPKFVMIEPSRFRSFPLDLSDIGRVRTYKAVTTGSALTQNRDAFAIYTGEDLKPQAVANPRATAQANGDITLTFTRGSRQNYTLPNDGDEELELNEAVEEYEVDLYDIATGTLLNTFTYTTDGTVTITFSERQSLGIGTGGGTETEISITNGDMDDVAAPGIGAWVDELSVGGTIVTFTSDAGFSPPGGAHSGSNFLGIDAGDEFRAVQRNLTFPLSTFPQVDTGELGGLVCRLQIQQGSAAGNDGGFASIVFRDSGGGIISTVAMDDIVTAQDQWTERDVIGAIPPGTRFYDLLIDGTGTSGAQNNVYFDTMRLWFAERVIAAVNDGEFEMEVFQISSALKAQGINRGRGRSRGRFPVVGNQTPDPIG